ncbi:MAG: hypothetical protein AAFV45_10290 [Pseudomonadota bacterium]
MDLVPIVNTVVAQTTSAAETVGPEVASIMETLAANWQSWLILSLVLVVSYWFIGRVAKRLFTGIEDTMFANWRLALLGATGVVLSLASGWTTWDGMRNFTGEPALSFMITFGIQGVMLIVAWLIGESFATGMNASGTSKAVSITEMFVAAAIGFLVVAGIIYLLIQGKLPFNAEQLAYFAIAIGVLALIALFQSEIAQPYLQSSRIIVRNAVLWVMFLACMTTSVFFSFDSLFSTIFPASERQRAAELRAQNQVSGILTDISQTIANEQLMESQRLFTTEGWQTYERQLSQLASVAQGSQDDIERFFTQKLENRKAGIAEQENRRSSANAQQAGLTTRKMQLTEELSRLQASRPEVSTAVVQQVQAVSEVRRRMDEQRAVMLAEEKGVEGSGKAGRGRLWREARAQLGRIEAQLQVAQERLRAPRERLAAIDRRIASMKGELAQIDGEIAKLRGEALTAEQRIAASKKIQATEESLLNVDPARILPAFEKAKVAFRQDPTRDGLTAVRTQCQSLLGALLSVDATKDRVRSIDCDPKQAAEAAGSLFALREGATVFVNRCAGGDKLEAQNSADDLFNFARRCLSDSGLSSDNTEALRKQINLAELNRDDKAHRFVVTWNAFQDGNRLAYLALAIAVAIDSLVFMSGLFGANAVRSPLQDVPSNKPRSAQQLEATIENALLPNKYGNARAALRAMQPITPIQGFTNEAYLRGRDNPEENAVRNVLSAGSSIGAVVSDINMPGRYLVRPELLEFLAIVAKREFEGNKQLADDAKDQEREVELKSVLSVALKPHVGAYSEIVLNNLHPMTDMGDGYSSEVNLHHIAEGQIPVVRRALNAGSTLGFVKQRQNNKGERVHEFEVHRQLYKTLCMISEANPVGREERRFAHEELAHALSAHAVGKSPPSQDTRDGGDLNESRATLAQSSTNLLADASRNASPHSEPRTSDDHSQNQSFAQPSPAAAPSGDYELEREPEPDSELGPNAFHQKLVDHFASELGYQDSDLEDVMEVGRELDVRLLRDALTKVLMQMPLEAQSVSKADRSLKSNIERAYEDTPEQFARTPEQSLALHDFSENLKTYRTLFLMSPGGAYRNLLEDIANELHANMDDGTLEPTDEQRLEFLMAHIRELDTADLSEVEGWDSAEQSLRKFEGQLAALASSS